MLTINVDASGLLDLQTFVTVFRRPLSEEATPADWLALLALEPAAPVPLRSDDQVREAIRALLREGGFKPSGRSKPASEYLRRAVAEGGLGSINPAVDACNVVSLHSGLPISVVDLARAAEPLRVQVAPPGAAYVFNASGQSMDVGGLWCLADAAGPCANGVKDSQRTKTDGQTRRTLSLLWGSRRLPGRAAQAALWYRELLLQVGAATEEAVLAPAVCPSAGVAPQ